MTATKMITPLRAIALPALVLGLGASSLSAVTLPYENDFTSDPSSDFTVASSSYSYDSELYGDVYRYRRGTNSTGLALVNAPALSAPQSGFTISTEIIPQANTSGSSFGFALMSDEAESEYILADWSSENQMRLLDIGIDVGLNATGTSSTVSFVEGNSYTLSVSGEYTGNQLDLTFTVSDGSNTDELTATIVDASSLYGNDYFGYRSYGSSTGTINFYDDFSLAAIPEPSAYAIAFGAAVGAITLLRRRKKNHL